MRIICLVFVLVFFAQAASAGDDLIAIRSAHPVAVTLDKLTNILEKKGITVFARINHSAGAKKAGLTLRPAEVLIFGNPKLGTPLMQSNQKIGLDLPLRVLVWEDSNGAVWLGYTSPDRLKARYNINDRDAVFEKMKGALKAFTSAAIK